MCRNINGYGRRDDVISLITRTTKGVANNYFYYDDPDVKDIQKQMPMFISTLTRKFYLTKSKDRNGFLHLIEEHKQLVETVKELGVKVNILYQHYEKNLKIQ